MLVLQHNEKASSIKGFNRHYPLKNNCFMEYSSQRTNTNGVSQDTMLL